MPDAMRPCTLSRPNPVQLRMTRSNPPDGWAVAVLAVDKWMRPPHDIGPSLHAIDLAQPGVVDRLRAARDRALAHDDRACPRARTSIWSKHLVAAMLPAPALHALAGVPLETSAVLLLDGMRPAAMVALPPTRICATAEPHHLATFLRGIAEPLLRAVAQDARLAPRLLWSNAANFLAWLFEQWRRTPGLGERTETLASAVLDAAAWPDGTPNPLHRHIDYVPTLLAGVPVTRRRRLCCLRDRLGQPLCVSCPKISVEARDAILRAAAH
jgi:ferric iron reductase protein FhuF